MDVHGFIKLHDVSVRTLYLNVYVMSIYSAIDMVKFSDLINLLNVLFEGYHTSQEI